MNERRVKRGIKIALIGTAAVGVFGFVTMTLWNWLVPAVFGGHAISFWQGLGILALSKILFGGFSRGHGRGRHWKRRWEKMTPEERERFRQGMAARCGSSVPTSA
jgi:hypothetical protein